MHGLPQQGVAIWVLVSNKDGRRLLKDSIAGALASESLALSQEAANAIQQLLAEHRWLW